MAILNFLKRKKKKEKKIKQIKEKVREVKPRKVKEPVKQPVKRKAAVSVKPKKISEVAYLALKKPQVTEKATDLTNLNQYVFRVDQRTNKKDVKRSIEDIYGVDVLKVRIINIPAKKRKLGRTEGWRKEYKKAIVKLKKDQKIEVLPR